MKKRTTMVGVVLLGLIVFFCLKSSGNFKMNHPAPMTGFNYQMDDFMLEEFSDGDVDEFSDEIYEELTQEELDEINRQKRMIWEDYYSICTEYSGVKAEPGYGSLTVASAEENTKIRVVGEQDGWCKIRSGTVTGFLPKDVLLSEEETWNYISENGFDTYRRLSVAELTTEKQMESEQYVKRLIKEARKEEEEAKRKKLLQEQEKENEEYETDYPDIRDDDWYRDWYDETAPLHYGSGEEISAYALMFVGNPYVYGGTSLTKGCDCSGFVQGVYSVFSIRLPRTSREQANVGRQVDFLDLKPGDLLFYKNGGAVINHVAMYIGGGKVVQAYDESHGIIITNWDYSVPCLAKRIVE